MKTPAKVFLWTSPLPLLFFALAQWYVNQYEGWGQWAAAPVLLLPVLLSIGLGIWGVVLTIGAAKRGEKWGALLVGTTTSGSLGLWFVLNLILMEIMRSFF